MSDLSNYLATHYLVADPAPSKKSKKKKSKGQTGLLITEDDDSSWSQAHSTKNGEDEALAAVAGTSAEFRKKKESSWKVLSSETRDSNSADAILASVAAETRAAQQGDDEMPVVDSADNVVKMSDGTHAGLQSAAAISAQLKKRQREEREEFERSKQGVKEAETVYRDATGRRIDVSMRRAAARKAAEEAEEKERQEKKALKGDVQLEEARKKKNDLEDAALMKFARHADDDGLNKELKEQQRWNDPMMQFMEPRKEMEKNNLRKGRPSYQGAAPPNRYGIKPGYRWDGVDRGNGFEAERFKALNRRERDKGLEYSWQMDE
ncbi:Pre-mRNA-splicing factor cwc-26 [Ceratocystis lukuohia]|uniref:Pre-mRNA-splicing factor cwc-26 n=1 Tax=Ceratocystis lukuohia TaxID=2019550 RepID=A0ABR4MBM0_9PEZI